MEYSLPIYNSMTFCHLGVSSGRLRIEEPEAQGWIMMVAVNIGALLKYGKLQGVVRRASVMGLLDRNTAAK
jgi:hypothetical protein